MEVGQIAELWRYPVKSMAGERIAAGSFDQYGMIGDRAWAMINAETGDVGWGKAYPGLLNLRAEYLREPSRERVYGPDVAPVAVRFPGEDKGLSGTDLDARVSDYVDAPLQLHPLEPPENREHYRWQTPVDYDAILKILGIAPDDPPPDMTAYDESLIAILVEHYAPPGTYNDMFPVHAMTTASLDHMQQQSGESFELQRFRPNFLIETVPGIEGLVEFEWIGKYLEIGDCLFRVEAKTIRCSMPARGQEPYGLPQNPKIAKSLFTESERFLGAYLSVVRTGEVRAGDRVRLSDLVPA